MARRVAAAVSEARQTVSNAAWLIAQRGVHLVTATLFALLVPRLMGPDLFGRYALLISVAMWFALLSGLGAVSLMTRTVPQFRAAGDTLGLRKLVTNLLVLRASTGVFTATTYFLIVALALGEPDWVAALLVAVGVLSRTVANLCFSLFLGLNQAARWGLGDLMRRVLTLSGVLIGFPVAGLRGACAGFALADLIVLAIGLSGAWRYLLWSSLDLRRSYLAPYLRTGTSFAAGNLLLALAQRSGETVVRLATANYVQVGYYGAAYSIYLTGGHALWQAALSFGPLLMTLLATGHADQVNAWLERLLKWMFVAASLASLATLLVADDLVPLVLGTDYRPVADCLWPLSLALFALALGSLGRLVALTLNRPGLSATAAAVEIALFWGLGTLLATRFGAFGMSLAALAGTVGYATVISCRIHGELPYSLRPALTAAGLALPFVPLIALRGSWAVNAMLLVVGAVGYIGLLLWRRVITVDEIAALRRVLQRNRDLTTLPT
jgi:O-antigen/teichoic acid export membrane protein